ncbi:Reverse transcriptase domain [Trinorchestia longiramus]|nr:Reverse transcriptase domain [Trinorchestia longiramus]
MCSCGSLELVPGHATHDVSTGRNLHITCRTAGKSYRTHRIWWTGPGHKQIRPGRYYAEENIDGSVVSLFLENVTKQDSGDYTCYGNLDGRQAQRAFTLNVHSNVQFSGTAPHQTLLQGADSPITCSAVGDPAPHVSWSRDGKRIPYNSDKYHHRSGSPHVLLVLNATRADAGTYTCISRQISSRMSHVDSFNVSVTVLHPPEFTSTTPSERYGFIGSSVNLSCSAVALPPANFSWHKHGQLLLYKLQVEEEPVDYDWLDVNGRLTRLSRHADRPNGPLLRLQQVELRHDRSQEHPTDDRYTAFMEEGMSTLQVNITNQSVFGDYECLATNSMGTAVHIVTLRQGQQPPTPHMEGAAAPHQTTRKVTLPRRFVAQTLQDLGTVNLMEIVFCDVDVAVQAKTNPKSFYKYVNDRRLKRDTIGPLIDSEGSTQTNNKSNAKILYTYFTSVFTHQDITEIPQPHVLNTQEILSDGVFTVEEVEEQLSILNPHKSTGPDDLGRRILKETAEVISEPLTNIFNRSLETGIVLDDWKRTNVTPILKKGNNQIPNNYRPISLTSVISKTIERLLKVRTTKHLYDTQHGLREKHSCLTNLLDFFGEVNRIYDRTKAVDLVYLDFQKVFNKAPPPKNSWPKWKRMEYEATTPDGYETGSLVALNAW